ncbi:Calcium-independent phospholipase A2-gamma like protein [Verticillium longisporum]|uniref:Calcium-independent phospholipase A2-gamma like protein n=1 Tax=Verticillium longisporum TaxID=100787 RepID=A0A8I3AKJ8_VERLO|nr:Calcium-independent phospholipase A2-gamma like protein [Verticillium longisporum]RBQ98739.1 hypothetical protein VDGD_00942 [Verticillium dahliae]
MPANDIRLLALDGGGVRSLSSLMILRSLMVTIDPDNPPKPCDYFDMIGGTNTGGLIAVMLGRLRMSVDECIAAFTSLCDGVFEKKKHHRVRMNGKLRGRFDSRALERAIKQILVRTNHDENILLRDASSSCRVFVCATSKETGDTVCLTSFRSPRSTHLFDCTTVWEACRATSATATFFDPIAIGPFGEQFVDGAVGGANNPVAVLWSQARDVWGAGLQGSLRCLVSIGTGVPALQPVRDNVLSILAALLTPALETETTAENFRRDKVDLDDDGRYFRFNVVRGLEQIGMDEVKKKAEIVAATGGYVASQDVLKQMRACARQPVITMCQLFPQSVACCPPRLLAISPCPQYEGPTDRASAFAAYPCPPAPSKDLLTGLD